MSDDGGGKADTPEKKGKKGTGEPRWRPNPQMFALLESIFKAQIMKPSEDQFLEIQACDPDYNADMDTLKRRVHKWLKNQKFRTNEAAAKAAALAAAGEPIPPAVAAFAARAAAAAAHASPAPAPVAAYTFGADTAAAAADAATGADGSAPPAEGFMAALLGAGVSLLVPPVEGAADAPLDLPLPQAGAAAVQPKAPRKAPAKPRARSKPAAVVPATIEGGVAALPPKKRPRGADDDAETRHESDNADANADAAAVPADDVAAAAGGGEEPPPPVGGHKRPGGRWDGKRWRYPPMTPDEKATAEARRAATAAAGGRVRRKKATPTATPEGGDAGGVEFGAGLVPAEVGAELTAEDMAAAMAPDGS